MSDTFVFDKDYSNEEQVAPHLEAFLAEHDKITAAGDYPYNDSFLGRIPGIAGQGSDELTAIYLLQGLRRSRIQAARVAELMTDGYKVVERVTEGARYRHLVLVPQGRMNGEWAEFEDARLVARGTDTPYAVLRKGKRTHGVLINGRMVLASTS